MIYRILSWSLLFCNLFKHLVIHEWQIRKHYLKQSFYLIWYQSPKKTNVWSSPFFFLFAYNGFFFFSYPSQHYFPILCSLSLPFTFYPQCQTKSFKLACLESSGPPIFPWSRCLWISWWHNSDTSTRDRCPSSHYRCHY